MYIAMNRFKVMKGNEREFENVWKARETHLDKMHGFIEFQLLRGPEREDHTLYSSHTTWNTFEDFQAWTNSEAFRAAHKGAGDRKPLFMGHPEFEGFHTIPQVALRAGAKEPA